MKKTYILLLTLTALTIPVQSSGAAERITTLPKGAVAAPSVEKAQSNLLIKMQITPSAFPKNSNREMQLTPMIATEGDTLRLDPVTVAGRTRYYQHLRTDHSSPATTLLKAGAKDIYEYMAVVPFEKWMEKSRLVVEGSVEGCCGEGLGLLAPETIADIDYRDKTIIPTPVYVSPKNAGASKSYTVTGKAYIDYPINETRIYPHYNQNATELEKIRETIEKVKTDPDMTITSLSFMGYASPEGAYANNERLAKGRTLSLIDYVQGLYGFPKSVIEESWVAENWQELDSIIMASDSPHKKEMERILNNDKLSPDGKEKELKVKFPDYFNYLREEVFPGMRRTDYTVTYLVRPYTDPKEIAEVMRSAPQKLSQGELFMYASTLDKDSPEFREAMEVAVRMYPDDPVANLNAAFTAIEHGDYSRAEGYLAKAPDDPQTIYARGAMEAKRGNYSEAETLLNGAAAAGVTEAAELLAKLRDFGYIQ